ncbi:MAG: hypothetical protein ABIG84_02220 [archaeon]
MPSENKPLGQITISGDNSEKYRSNDAAKYHLSDVGEVMTYMLVLDKIRKDMTVGSTQDLTWKLTNMRSKNGGKNKEPPIYSNLQSTSDRLNNLNPIEMDKLYENLRIEDGKTGFEFDARKNYDSSWRKVESAVQSTVDKLLELGLVEKVEVSAYYDELANKEIASYLFWPTKEGVDTLKSAGFYNKFDKLKDDVLKTLLYYEQKKMGPINSIGKLSNVLKKHELYDGAPKDIDQAINYLENRNLVKYINNKFVLTDKGGIYCDHMGIDFSKKPVEKSKPASSSHVKQPVESLYNWPDLRRSIFSGFGGALDVNANSVNNIGNKPLRLISEDRIGEFYGGVYILLNDLLGPVGYLNKDGYLIPSPELIKTAFVEKNNGGSGTLREFIKSLDESHNNRPLSALFMNDLKGMADALDKNTYRDICELVSKKKGNVSFHGKKLLEAANELFGKQEYSVIDKDGKLYPIKETLFADELFASHKS